jgi:hypothetical protein
MVYYKVDTELLIKGIVRTVPYLVQLRLGARANNVLNIRNQDNV